jgi:DNA-binding transcriptional ArsR family regulator
MDKMDAAAACRALAQPTRLSAFRAIVAGEGRGVAVGDLAGRLGVPHNTLSSHLRILSEAGLIRVEPDGRRRLYRVESSGVRALTQFLMADCCGGRPEQCLPGTGPDAPATTIDKQ